MLPILLLMMSSYAQILNLSQSDSSLEWKTLQSDKVKIYHPAYNQDHAHKLADFIELYSQPVSQSYGEAPKSFPLILRSQGSIHNGFVTLAPRRSEFFDVPNFSASFGANDFLETLAVHEYRHIIQYDYLNRGNARIWNYLFGELGRSFGVALMSNAWQLEGDAVWAETKFTQSGRGRLPRFSAQWESLISQGSFPRYDILLMGSYDYPYPNHYVWGYYLVTRAINKYGEDIWAQIYQETSTYYINPYQFYNAFKSITGESFDDFFKESLKELQLSYQKLSLSNEKKKDLKPYETYLWPHKVGKYHYVLRRNLDSFWQLLIDNQVETDIDLNIQNKIDINAQGMIYVQRQIDRRFFYKNYQDLFIYSFKQKRHKRITQSKRYFHPQFLGENIVALNFNDRNKVELHILNLQGKVLDKSEFKEIYPINIAVINDKELGMILMDQQGRKLLGHYHLIHKKLTKISDTTRNNLFALAASGDRLLFEAQFKGHNQIFSYHLHKKLFSQCTSTRFGAFHPHVNQSEIFYTQLTVSGNKPVSHPLACREITQKELFSGYLSSSHPNDQYTKKSTPPARKKALTKSNDHHLLDDALNIHSWSFIAGNGLGLSVASTNYLNTLSLYGSLGTISDEGTGAASFGMQYNRYTPLFGIYYSYANRALDRVSFIDTYNESTVNFSLQLPWLKRTSFFNHQLVASLEKELIMINDRKRLVVGDLFNDQLDNNIFKLSVSSLKDRRLRETIPSMGVQYQLTLNDAKALRYDSFNNFKTAHDLTIFTPSGMTNANLRLQAVQERMSGRLFAYQLSDAADALSAKFSRGYSYIYTPYFHKLSLNLDMPLINLDNGYKDWIYTNRLTSNFFFDSSIVRDQFDKTLNSFGAEFNFETLVFRKLPLMIGNRILHRQRDQKNIFEFLLSFNQPL